MTFILATENIRKCYQAPFPIFRTGPGNEANYVPHCLPEYVAGRVIPNEDPDGEDIWVDLGSIMSFATGSDHPPPLGFPNAPDIQFETDLSKILPFASTCAPNLYLPLVLNEPDLFKKKMGFSICCADGFGIP